MKESCRKVVKLRMYAHIGQTYDAKQELKRERDDVADARGDIYFSYQEQKNMKQVNYYLSVVVPLGVFIA